VINFASYIPSFKVQQYRNPQDEENGKSYSFQTNKVMMPFRKSGKEEKKKNTNNLKQNRKGAMG